MSILVIDDNNFDQFKGDATKGELCGALPRKVEYGKLTCAPARAGKTIPREQWPDLIADMERDQSSLYHIWQDTPIGVLMQDQLNYCHGFSCVMGVMLQRAKENLPFEMLSASSIAAPITRFQNAGAVISDDLEQAVNVGAASIDFVPMLTTQKKDFKPGWEADAAKNRISRWVELAPRNFDEHASELLTANPVCVALNYWGHAVTDMVLKDLNPGLRADDLNRYGVLFINSWSAAWGDKGFAVRAGNKKFADQMYSPRQILASLAA